MGWSNSGWRSDQGGWYKNAAGVAGYTGPVDAVAGATHYWGLRATTSASIGASAVELRESGGNTLQTFATISGGGLDLAAIATFKGANSVFIRRIYDQIGTDHMIQTNTPDQPELVLNVQNGLPVARVTSGGFLAVTLAGGNIPSPYVISSVARRTTGTTASFFAGEAFAFVIFSATSGRITMTNSTGLDANGNAENTFHSIGAKFNGGSSDLNIDGVSNLGTVNTNALGSGSGGSVGWFAAAGQGNAVNSEMMEQIIYPSALNSTNLGLLYTNQRGYWNY